MYELPQNPMMSALLPSTEVAVEALSFNAAELDVGYEVAFPFLTPADEAEQG